MGILARLGRVCYWTGMFIAIIFILVAALLTTVDTMPLSTQIFLIFVALITAAISWACGGIIHYILTGFKKHHQDVETET